MLGFVDILYPLVTLLRIIPLLFLAQWDIQIPPVILINFSSECCYLDWTLNFRLIDTLGDGKVGSVDYAQ